MQKPREFWIDPGQYNELEEGAILDALTDKPIQGPLQWQASLIHVCEMLPIPEDVEKWIEEESMKHTAITPQSHGFVKGARAMYERMQGDTDNQLAILGNELGYDNSCCYDREDLLRGIKGHVRDQLAEKDARIAELEKLNQESCEQWQQDIDQLNFLNAQEVSNRDADILTLTKQVELLNNFIGIMETINERLGFQFTQPIIKVKQELAKMKDEGVK